LGTVRVVVSTGDRSPFPVDAVVVEDDTYGVLGADPLFREPIDHPIRIWTELHELEPATPGTVTLEHGRTPRLLAVVHDLSGDPSWREEWVSSALAASLRQAERLRVESLGVQALGTIHGRLGPERFLELLRSVVEREALVYVRRIWLIPRPEHLGEMQRLLVGFERVADETE
jgi:hypothetical protein